jgi:hypothetical protein
VAVRVTSLMLAATVSLVPGVQVQDTGVRERMIAAIPASDAPTGATVNGGAVYRFQPDIRPPVAKSRAGSMVEQVGKTTGRGAADAAEPVPRTRPAASTAAAMTPARE